MRIEVIGGGEPSDEELAAVVVVLSAVGRDGAEPGVSARPEPAWGRASRLEGIGDRRAVSADDLAILERTVGRI